jgi:alpha-N-arabinofuranosidase
VLRTPVLSPEYDTHAFGPVPTVDSAAVLSAAADELTVFVVNRDQHAHAPVEIDVRSLPALRVAHHTYIGDDDPAAANTVDAQERIVPRTGADLPVDGGMLRVALPALSWNMLRIRP